MNQGALCAFRIGALLRINRIQLFLCNGCALQQEVTDEQIAEDFQIGGCVQNGDQKAGALAQRSKGHGQIDDGVVRLFQIGGVFLQFRDLFRLRNGSADLADHIHDIHPLVLAELPAHEIEGLNAVGSLIETGDLAIPHVLLHGIFLAVSIATVNVNGLRGDLHGHIGRIGLADRGQ